MGGTSTEESFCHSWVARSESIVAELARFDDIIAALDKEAESEDAKTCKG